MTSCKAGGRSGNVVSHMQCAARGVFRMKRTAPIMTGPPFCAPQNGENELQLSTYVF